MTWSAGRAYQPEEIPSRTMCPDVRHYVPWQAGGEVVFHRKCDRPMYRCCTPCGDAHMDETDETCPPGCRSREPYKPALDLSSGFLRGKR